MKTMMIFILLGVTSVCFSQETSETTGSCVAEKYVRVMNADVVINKVNEIIGDGRADSEEINARMQPIADAALNLAEKICND